MFGYHDTNARRPRHRMAAVCAAGVVALAACSSTTSSTPAGQSGAAGGAQIRTVQMDGKTDAFNGAFMAYFPKSVMVHPGDTVVFHDNDTGEPHSVTMGTLVEKGLAAAAKADPNGPPPPEFAGLPLMLPEGPGDAVQAGARPCYLATGTPPTDPTQPCPQVAQPDFDGTQAYYSSGAIKPGGDFTVRVAANTPPGTYNYYCDLHGSVMSGSVVVVAASQPIPSQADVDAAARTEKQAMVAKVMPDYQAAKAGKASVPGNLAGLFSMAEQQVEINEFLPKEITVKAGQPVTWTVLGVHTITFGGPDHPPSVLEFAADGAVRLRQDLLAPAGGPGLPQPGPDAPPPTGPVPVDGGSYPGTGLHSSGFLPSIPPALITYTLTFPNPGTYNVDCVIHPNMKGKVVVIP